MKRKTFIAAATILLCALWWGAAAAGDIVRPVVVGGLRPLSGNINLNGHYLSGDGDDEGIFINADGKVGIGTTGGNSSLAIGDYYSEIISSIKPVVSISASSDSIQALMLNNASDGESASIRFTAKANSGDYVAFDVASENHTGSFFGYPRNDSGVIFSKERALAMGTLADDPVVFGVSGNEVARLTSNGVGIGTTSPDASLDSLDASGPQLRLTHTDGSVYNEYQTDSSGALLSTGPGVTLADDATYSLPDATEGYGVIMGGGEYMPFRWATDGTVTLLVDASANTANTDSDTDLCAYDGGTQVVVKNRLGSEQTFIIRLTYQ